MEDESDLISNSLLDALRGEWMEPEMFRRRRGHLPLFFDMLSEAVTQALNIVRLQTSLINETEIDEDWCVVLKQY